jgi:hypothetical protein
MSKDMAGCLGSIVGGLAGFFLGMYAWIYGYYLLVMKPLGTPIHLMDQAAMPSLFTGILGAALGAYALQQLCRRFGRGV